MQLVPIGQCGELRLEGAGMPDISSPVWQCPPEAA